MAWSSYYSATSGAGRLSRILKETKQRLLLTDAVLTELPDPEQISISRSAGSLSGNRDVLSSGIARNISDAWKLPLEPYNKMRLWLKFECGLSPKDWSYYSEANRTWIKTSGKEQPLKRLVRDDGITEGQVYNLFDGRTQWVEVQDNEAIRLSDMLLSNNEINISVFLSPFSGVTFDEEGYTDLFYKVDSDEIQYAYRARLKSDGSIQFTVIDNYAVQQVVTDPGVVDIYDFGDFSPLDFDPTEFDTLGPEYQLNPDVDPPYWTIISFCYNIITRTMQVWTAKQNNPDTDPNDVTVTQHVVTPHPQDTTNLSMHIPLNEGNGETLHDASGQENHGTMADSPNAPLWEGNNLRFAGDTKRFTIENAIEIDALSTFTLAFKLKLTSYSQSSSNDVILSKNYPSAVLGTGGFALYMAGSGSNNMVFTCKNNSGTTRTVTLTNAVPSLETWYDVIITYNGTIYTLKVNSASQTLSASGDTMTASPSSSDWIIGDPALCFQGYVSDLQIYKGRVWDSDDTAYFTDLEPGYRGGFPIWQPLPPPPSEDPVPVVRPLSKIYDVAVPSGTPGQVQLNNPASTTPFSSFYDVNMGEATTDPEVTKYNVPDGTETSGTADFVSGYSLSGQNSTADLVWDSGDRGYGQIIRTSSSWINGKRLGRITIAGLKRSSDASGTIQIGIIKANGSFIGFGSSFSASSLSTSDWTTKTADNTANAHPTTGYACAVGDGVGILWTGGDGTIYVQRGGSNSYEDLSRSCQATFEDDDEWHITNSSYAMAGIFYTGGYTEGSPAFFKMGSTSFVVGHYQVNSTLEGIIPSHVVWRVRRVGSAASAVLVCRIRNSASSTIYTFPQTVSFNSIGTTTQDISFSDTGNTVAWADNYKITLEFSVVTGINNTTNYLEVNFNPGSGTTGYVGGTSIRAQYYTGSGYDDLEPAADWAGQIYTGGASFTPWIALNATRKRFGEKIVSNSPSPNAKGYGRKVTKATLNLRKVGTPTGPIKFLIYKDGVTTPQASGFSQIQADSLTTSGVAYDFTWVFNAYITALNDYLVCEYNDGTADNYIEIGINTDAAAGASGDGQKMVAVEYVSGAWATKTAWDLSAIFYEGGIPDLTSRNRVATVVMSDASLLKSQKITEVTHYFKKTTGSTLTGNVEIWSRRGSDDTPRDLLGSFAANSLSDTVWTAKQVINRDALQYLGVTDKISIEYSGGNQTNGVLVMLRNEDTFDENETMYVEYDSVQWGSAIDNKEIVGEMWIGGDTYTPDPGTPVPIPPDAYNHNLFILGGGGTDSITGIPTTMAGMRIRDFRLLAGAVYGSGELTNLVKNKHTILDTLIGQTSLGGYTTLTSE